MPKNDSGRSLGGFLKKRAPIYLGLTGLFVVFAVPGLMNPGIDDVMPDELSGYETRVLDGVMKYNGPDGDGLEIIEAINMRLVDEFGDSVYKDGTIGIMAEPDDNGDRLVMDFKLDKTERTYSWHIDPEGNVEGLDPASAYIVELVDFYD